MRKLKNPEEITYVYTSLRDEIEEYKHKYSLMKTNANQLASRIDKAIEKLEYYNSGEALYFVPVQDIIEILKGDSND